MNILIADDDKYTREIIREILTDKSYVLCEAENGIDTLKIAQETRPDLIILDVMMPGIDGFEICSTIKEEADIYGSPLILMLTAKGNINDLATGFNRGANDYLKKPFEYIELELRVKALLKHKVEVKPKMYKYKSILLDLEKTLAYENETEVKLTKKEFELLLYLIINKGIVISKDKIMENVWNRPIYENNRSIENFIRQLKAKFKDLENNIETVIGFGYRLV